LSRKLKFVLAITLVLSLSPSAWAARPEDALSSRAGDSLYIAGRVDNFGGVLRKIFTSPYMDLVTPRLRSEDVEKARLITTIALTHPARSVAMSWGIASDLAPFIQIAAEMDEDVRPQMDRVGSGNASNEDLVKLLLGDVEGAYSDAIDAVLQQGPGGNYYLIDGKAVLAAKDNMLLASASSADLEASIEALAKPENRLIRERRFKNPNYYVANFDMQTLATLSPPKTEEERDSVKLLAGYFDAPLKIEVDLEPRKDGVLVSTWVNVLEAIRSEDQFNIEKRPGAGMFLAGTGRMLLGISGGITLENLEKLSLTPRARLSYDKLFEELEKMGIPKDTIFDLTTGYITIGVGSDATILGRRSPGIYLAMNGRNGAASKVLGKFLEEARLVEDEVLLRLDAPGWDELYAINQSQAPEIPFPLALGVQQETLFVGIIDPEGINEKPGLPDAFAGVMKDDLYAGGFFDAAAVWDYLRSEAADSDSNIRSALDLFLIGAPFDIGVIQDILGSELPISFIKYWAPTLETTFADFATADVPRENDLIRRIVGAVDDYRKQLDERRLEDMREDSDEEIIEPSEDEVPETGGGR
jgi:hypothetical protein